MPKAIPMQKGSTDKRQRRQHSPAGIRYGKMNGCTILRNLQKSNRCIVLPGEILDIGMNDHSCNLSIQTHIGGFGAGYLVDIICLRYNAVQEGKTNARY